MGSKRSTSGLSRSLLDLCRMRKLTIATAESCTGGLVAGALTDIPGSSDVIDRAFVTYSNEAKRVMLGVKATTLGAFGAVSKETATAMTAVNPSTDPTARSIPPVRITNVIPAAKTMLIDAWRTTLTRLFWVRKFGVSKAKRIQMTASTGSIPAI